MIGNAQQGPVPAEDYRLIFELTPAGAAIYDELWRIFAKDAVLVGGTDAVLQTYHRMGARSVLEHIVKKINLANNVPDTDSGSGEVTLEE